MSRAVAGKGLRLSLRLAPCAHICRYCLISETRKGTSLPWDRFEQLGHRFIEWKADCGREDMSVGFFIGPSYDFDLEILHGLARLRAHRGDVFETLNLGGLRIRRDEALAAWLDERRSAGVTGLHASLAGYGETHDRWNGRAGDFDYQMSILRLGGERGMARVERLFLTRNTLPLFDKLLDILDALPGESRRRAVTLFFFAGLAHRYEDERITEEIRDNLPDRLKRLRGGGRFNDWKSEREWIPIMMETADLPRRLILKLDVNENNIDKLEAMSCEEIFVMQERHYQEEYARIPMLDELCARYGDRENRRVYMMSRDVEGRWLEMHSGATGIRPPID
ncbi:MAG TPA: radical SAM protein [Stellaceae bacterium]|jgi:hypothetical protein